MDGLRTFDDPEAKDFAGVQYLIDIAVLLIDLVSLCTRIAGYNAVYQRGTEGVFLLNPLDEVIAQIPLTSIAHNAFLQFLAVVVNQLTSKNDEAFAWLSAELLETTIQELGKLCRIGGRRSFGELTGLIICDTSLCSVAGDEAQFRIVGTCHYSFVICIAVQAAAHTRNHALLIDLLAVLETAQVQCVQAVLIVDNLCKIKCSRWGSDWLYQNNLGVKACVLVHHVDEVINKCTHEIAFAELQNAFRCMFQYISVIAGFFQCLIRQMLHDNILSFCILRSYRVTPCLKIAISWNPACSDFTGLPEATSMT